MGKMKIRVVEKLWLLQKHLYGDGKKRLWARVNFASSLASSYFSKGFLNH